MEFLGLSLLDRKTLFEIMIKMISGIPVGINQGFHGDDGPRTTQCISVLDGHARRFDDSTDSCTAGFVAFTMSTTRGRCMNKRGLHRE